MAAFKPAYLIHGDDHGRLGERRNRLRLLAEEQSGTQGVEVLEGEEGTPEAAARALDAMTFALGRRFIVVDGAERWKEKDLEPLEAALANMPPDTSIVFFAREEGRAKAPQRLHDAVLKAGGDVSTEESVKPWELPKWVIARARELKLSLEPDVARAMIQHVGDRQQRLLRELEKLALGARSGTGPEAGATAGAGVASGAGTTSGSGAAAGALVSIDAAEIEELTAASAERKAWSLADALLAGEPQTATRVYLTLRAQGERVPGLIYWMGQRLRVAHDVACAIEAGQPVAQIKRNLRMPSRAADRLIGDARRSGAERLAQAIVEIAALELASRGGASGGESEDTAALRAIQRIAA